MSENGTIAPSAASTPSDALADDLLVGAEAIARELDWKTQDGKWHRRRVYHLVGKGLPIHRVKGLGICARRSALRAYFAALDSRVLKMLEASAKTP